MCKRIKIFQMFKFILLLYLFNFTLLLYRLVFFVEKPKLNDLLSALFRLILFD